MTANFTTRIQLPILVTLIMALTLSSIQIVSSAPLTKDSSHRSKLDLEFESANLSPKLASFYERLHAAEPQTMAAGLIKFHTILSASKSSDEFLAKISHHNLDEQAQAKNYLAELVEYLQTDYPTILNWLLSTTYGDNHSVTRAQLNFLDTFSKYDEEMSVHKVWNQYWEYLFKMIGDFILSKSK